MFASVGRRLALLNAAIVVVVIAFVGGTTFVLLRASLNREVDSNLRERARGAETTWAALFEPGAAHPAVTPVPASGDDGEGEHNSDSAEESEASESDDLIGGGDTLLYAFAADGTLIADARGVPVTGLPDSAAVAVALDGNADTRNRTVLGNAVRVYTEPVIRGGSVVGAVQAVRGQAQHRAELRLVGLGSLAGIGMGLLLVVPAALFLAHRAMRPIGVAFVRQRTFVADASHELRTPLTLIRANVEWLQRLRADDAELRDETGRVLGEIDAMAKLVDDLLILARLDDAAAIVEHVPLDLSAVVRDAVDTMTDRAARAGLALTIEAARPVSAVASAERVRQMVRILLDNAISYTPAGGKITVIVTPHGDEAMVRVADTGVGIAPADQARVFDRFYRADKARGRSHKGSGLGLPIARALAEAQGGRIGLESTADAGTTVWFTLPLAKPSDSPTPSA